MLGAIIGDVIGSKYQNRSKERNYDFALFTDKMYFTDDTVLTVAVANVMIKHYPFTNVNEEKLKLDLVESFIKQYHTNSHLTPFEYGARFNEWIKSKKHLPYKSFGNGSAMRISSVAYCTNSLKEVKKLSKIISEITHNSREGIRGATAIAVSIYLALHGAKKDVIKKYIVEHYYKQILFFEYEDLVQYYDFDVTCDGSVPVAIYAFLISDSFEDCIRKCICIGGDTDTIAAMAGSIAEAFYGIGDEIKRNVYNYLTKDIKKTLDNFNKILLK